MKVKLLTIILVVCAAIASAQSGTLRGKVTDKGNNQPLPLSLVSIEQNGMLIASDTARLEGEYTIRPVAPGRYTVKASLPGYQTVVTTDVIIKADQSTYVDLKLASSVPAPANKGKKKKARLKRVE